MIQHLYVHIPFCHRICPYCGFYKHKPGSASDMQVFLDALVREAELLSERYPIQLKTVYFGGGTPTLPATAMLDGLLSGLHRALDLSALEEWTMEANPATFDRKKAGVLLDHGVTRISLGIQSWQPPTLEILGRDHSPEQAEKAFHILRAADFPVVSIDQMFAIPHQSLDMWEADLDQSLRLEPDHISCYNLTYEEDTEFLSKFETGEYSQDHDDDASFFKLAMEKLTSAGYEHYEISNYSRPGFQSVHNKSYWSGADYLGLGPSAVSTLGPRRWKNVADTATYVALVEKASPTIAAAEEEVLTPEQKQLERLALQLRTASGLPLSLVDLDAEKVEHLREENLLALDESSGTISLTNEGKLVADSVAAYLG